MFLYKAEHILRIFLCFHPFSHENFKNVFSRFIFSNTVKVPSSMHSNVQVLYLLLFFAVGVGVAVAFLIVSSKLETIFTILSY